MIANQEAHAGILEAGDKIVWSFRVFVGGSRDPTVEVCLY